MFQTFTGKEYLKIDIANNFGLDKLSWDDRIAWFDTEETRLHSLLKQSEEPALFYAGIQAWEATKKGQPSGYPISLDATCSGIQILAALACDRDAAKLCNVVDTGQREDAYTAIYREMVRKLGDTSKIGRKQTKTAIMTAFYGSTAQPKNVFGEGTTQLQVFYETMKERAPGAWEINETMLAIWDSTALENRWVMPDNWHVLIKVMGQVKETVHFLNEPFDVTYSENMPIDGGRSLGANMVHSIDGLVVREMVRRCHYDVNRIADLARWVRHGYCGKVSDDASSQLVVRLWNLYQKSGFLSARILDHLAPENLGHVDPLVIANLLCTLPAKPFEVLTVHDCFRCLPNYGNALRRQYNQLLAEIANSEMLSFLVSQMVGRPVSINKLDASLPADIQETNYALS